MCTVHNVFIALFVFAQCTLAGSDRTLHSNPDPHPNNTNTQTHVHVHPSDQKLVKGLYTEWHNAHNTAAAAVANRSDLITGCQLTQIFGS